MSIATSIFQTDGAYANLVSGLGNASMDKDEHTRIVKGLPLPDFEALAAQYMKDGIVKRLAKYPADKALKSPIIINDDKDDETFKALSKLGFFKAMRKAGTWARLFGGALVVTVFDGDGNDDLSREVSGTAKIRGYRVYSPGVVMLGEGDIVDDPKSKWHGKVEVFRVLLRSGHTLGIHASRCRVIRGNDVPDELNSDIYSFVFGGSEVDAANTAIKKLPVGFGALSNMLQECGISIFSLNGLSSMLATEGGLTKVRERISLTKLGMSTMRAVFLDKEDAFEMKSHQLSEVPETMKMLMAYVSAATGFPVSILFGNYVSGLSSTNEGDIRQFNDLVETWREDTLYEPMVEMITEYSKRNEGKSGVRDFQFGEVTQSTAVEKADLREKNANFVKTMFDMGAMTPKEARENLVVNGGTSEISVKGAAIQPATPKAGEEAAG